MHYFQLPSYLNAIGLIETKLIKIVNVRMQQLVHIPVFLISLKRLPVLPAAFPSASLHQQIFFFFWYLNVLSYKNEPKC